MYKLSQLIKNAKTIKPPRELKTYCGIYYQPYYNFMYLAAKQIKELGWCVELGSETGRGLMALGLFGALTAGFDNHYYQELSELSRKYDNVLFFNRPSLPIWEVFFKNKKIGLLHIDTEHSYAQAKEEFNAYKPYLIDGAIVVFDDLYAQDNDVLRFFEELEYDKIQDDDMHPVCGWGVMRYSL